MNFSWIKNWRGNQYGSSGIAALMVMSLLTVLGAGLVMLSSTESNISAGSRDGMAAQYLAEAGVQHAIVKLKTDTAFVTNSNTTTISTNNTLNSAAMNVGTATAGTYKVIVTGTGNSRKIISNGTVNKAKRQLVVNVSLPSGGAGVFDLAAAYSAGSMTINWGTVINGDIGSNNSITQNGGTINGNVISSTGFTKWGGTVGSVSQTSANITVPAALPAMPVSFNSANYTGQPLNSQINSGTMTLSAPYYIVNGPLQLNSGAALSIPAGQSVTIFVNGSIELNSGTSIQGNVTLIANGSVQLNGGYITAANAGNINIYANGAVQLNSGSSLNTTNGSVKIMTTGSVGFNGGDVNVTGNGKTEVYAATSIQLNSNSDISNNGLLMAGGTIQANGGTAANTVVISNSNVQVNSGSILAGVYAVGPIQFNGGQVNYNSTVIQNLGLAGEPTPFTVNSWNNK